MAGFGNLDSIGGFDTFCKTEDVYDIIYAYNYRLINCDGSYNNYLWLDPPQTSDCNIIAWMEAFCWARRHRPRDYPQAAEYARAIDASFKYDIEPGRKVIKLFYIIPEAIEDYFIVYRFIY